MELLSLDEDQMVRYLIVLGNLPKGKNIIAEQSGALRYLLQEESERSDALWKRIGEMLESYGRGATAGSEPAPDNVSPDV